MIKADQLGSAIEKELSGYADQLKADLGEVFEEVAEQALTEIRTASKNAGFEDHQYSRGWTKLVQLNKSSGIYHVTIHNKKHYQLTHLLEKGHAKTNGGRTRAFPHIGPTQEKMDRLVVDEVEKAIRETT